ncbi:MAG: hypothetical protein VKO21_06610 [Candidatus Sericytochromatia bacterium]|nr:hypothetical protein [Candidatus Sericytochromatia bacterium]
MRREIVLMGILGGGGCAPLAPGVDVVLPGPAVVFLRLETSEPPWQVVGEDRRLLLRRWWPDEAVIAVGRLPAGMARARLSVVTVPRDGLHELEVSEAGGRSLWVIPWSPAAGPPWPESVLSLPATAVAAAARWAVRAGKDPGGWSVPVRARSRTAAAVADRLAKAVRAGSLPEGPAGWLQPDRLPWELRGALEDLASGSPPLPAPTPGGS